MTGGVVMVRGEENKMQEVAPKRSVWMREGSDVKGSER